MGNAGMNTARYLFAFLLVGGGNARFCLRAWRAPSEALALKRVQNYYTKRSLGFGYVGAVLIPGSQKFQSGQGRG